MPYQSSMAAHFVSIDYDTPLILPPNLRDWLAAPFFAPKITRNRLFRAGSGASGEERR